MGMEDNTELITVREAANYFRISQIHLRKMLNQGIIPYLNLTPLSKRKNIRISKKAVDEFISKGGIQ